MNEKDKNMKAKGSGSVPRWLFAGWIMTGFRFVILMTRHRSA